MSSKVPLITLLLGALVLTTGTVARETNHLDNEEPTDVATRSEAFGLAFDQEDQEEVSVLPVSAPSAKLMNCLCKVESKCNKGIGCKWDRGSYSCGPYQIKEAYWKDASKQAGHKLGGSWKLCTTGLNNMACSELAVRFYAAKYAQRCTWPLLPTDKDFARIHNGGPKGCRRRDTLAYWYKVKRCMTRQDGEMSEAA